MTKNVISMIGIALMVVACGSDKPEGTKPVQQIAARTGTLVNNIQLVGSAASLGLCAQLVDSKGKRLIEISAGPCPASGLVDSTKVPVFEFSFRDEGLSNRYEIFDLEYNQRVGGAEAPSGADRGLRKVSRITSVCSDSEDLCSIDTKGGKFIGIEMY